ncbi:MAG: prolyl oligopeptidase family serine peptidase [Bacteroidales bacterium]|nr:prolyl oligopeptidase family serine peptidase [Bacteroidales bacterium]
MTKFNKPKSRYILLTVLIGFISLCNNNMKAESNSKSSQSAKIFSSNAGEIQYLLYLPGNYKKTELPLIMFLHGAGERGSNIELVKKHGPPKLVEQNDFPFIIVSPQCPAEKWWDINLLNELLDEVTKLYKVDKSRIYLTGLSMGGYGTWALAAKYPQKFAAIAPICGGGDPNNAESIKSIPTWVFHGAKDSVVPLSESEKMVKALRKVDGFVTFTVYPEAGHDSWTDTYNNEALYDWFLNYQKK